MVSIEKKRGSTQQSPPSEIGELPTKLGTVDDLQNLTVLGYTAELRRNRSMFTLLFQSLAIAAVSPVIPCLWLCARIDTNDVLLQIPYGFGGPLISAIYGGGEMGQTTRYRSPES